MVNELANLKLKAITLGGDRPYALINDQILQVGDESAASEVVKIESDDSNTGAGRTDVHLAAGGVKI